MVALFFSGCVAQGTVQVEASGSGATPQTPPDSLTPPATPPDSPTESPDGTSTSGSPLQDYSVSGPIAVSSAIESLETSCGTEVTAFVPAEPIPNTLVVLTHGFARSKEQMAGWAEHMASWGLTTVTPDLCGFIAIDHEQNAADIELVADTYGAGADVAYVGHSAGGLASLLAAASDRSTLTVLGLDLTDTALLGVNAASDVSVPVASLFGEPDLCNAFGSGVAAVAMAPTSTALRLNGSDHCDFENPSDGLCDLACANGTADDVVTTTLIAGLSTSWLMAMSGADPDAFAWWTAGDPHFDALVADGLVTAL